MHGPLFLPPSLYLCVALSRCSNPLVTSNAMCSYSAWLFHQVNFRRKTSEISPERRLVPPVCGRVGSSHCRLCSRVAPSRPIQCVRHRTTDTLLAPLRPLDVATVHHRAEHFYSLTVTVCSVRIGQLSHTDFVSNSRCRSCFCKFREQQARGRIPGATLVDAKTQKHIVK